MTIDSDVKITINISELVNIRSVFLQEEMSEGEIEDLANELRLTLTWDTLYGMVDDAILQYLDKSDKNYGEIQPEPGREAELTKRESEAKKRKQYFEKNFDLVELDGGSWKLQVPVRKK